MSRRALGLRLSAPAGGRRAAVLGRPVAHSLSPVLHRAAYAALGLDWTYEAIDCGAAELGGVLRSRADWAGFSCTMPLKRAVLERADEVAPAARRVGAGNTLLPRPGGGWTADNTDVVGVDESLAGVDLAGADVAVVGAGGTAQAVVAALAGRGATHAAVLVRDPARADDLRATAERCGVSLELREWHHAAVVLTADVVVSTVPAGAADDLAGHAWHAGQVVLDVIYEPWPTPLAAAAAAAGADVRSGALMLLHQAAAQVRLMTGREAPVEAMRTALRAARPHVGV